MGFFSSICSCVSSAISSVASAVSSGISKLGSTLKSVGETVGKLANKMGGGLGLAIAAFIPVVGDIVLVAQAISMIARGLGLVGEEETPEELGVKAEEAEKKPEDFNSTEEYINYLKNEVSVDKSKFENISQDELTAYKVSGSAILLDGISEKKGINISPTFVRDFAKVGLNGKQIETVIDKFKENKAKADLEGYFNGDLTMKEDSKIDAALEKGLKENFGDLSNSEIFKKIDDMRDEYLKED